MINTISFQIHTVCNNEKLQEHKSYQPKRTMSAICQIGESYGAANIAFKKADVTSGGILFTPAHLILTLLISVSPHRTKIIH